MALHSYDSRIDKFVDVDSDNRLDNGLISRIMRSDRRLFVVTQNRLYIYDVEVREANPILTFITKFDTNSSLSRNVGAMFDGGKIFLGTSGGLTVFDDLDRLQVPINNRVVISEVLVDGTPIANYTYNRSAITLPHSVKSLGFKFDGVSYINPIDIEYEYKLEGVDVGWNYRSASANTITYANLAPGDYRLYIRKANYIAESESEAATLMITITPPIYRTTVAYIIYLLMIAVATTLFIRWRRGVTRQKISREVDRFRDENEKSLYQFKLNFFSNITHEIRTPLMLITAPVKQVLERGELDERDANSLQMVSSNCSRLLTIANQLLDFKESKNLSYELKLSRFDLSRLFAEIVAQYTPLAALRGVQLESEFDEDGLYSYVVVSDREAITKIVTNLLNNALKYTRSLIVVSLHQSESGYKIVVADNGKGVAAECKEQIFDLYYTDSDKSKGGVGIGLSLCKMLAEQLGGGVKVEDNFVDQSESGAVFSLELPLEMFASDSVEFEQEVDDDCDSDDSEDSEEQGERATILIVDDEQDMLSLIGDSLSGEFDVLVASSAEQALEIMSSSYVALCVSDVKMAEMDGYELCERIKSTPELSHIPVILMTASGSSRSRIESYNSGAEGYVSKPFEPEVLVARIKSVIKQRQELIDSYTRGTSSKIDDGGMSQYDKEFINRCTELVKANITCESYNVESMAQDLGISRTSLYMKIRATLAISPNSFIRLVRLKESAALFDAGEDRVNEVCYRVGFNTPSYFIKCFTKQFGLSPKSYIMKLRGK